MASANLVMHEEDLGEIQGELARLKTGSNARFVFLIDRSGQHLAFVGETEGVDTTSLASLAAGNVAATEGLAQLLGESAFQNLYQEGEQQSLHISLIGTRTILVLAFDEHSSLGLVRGPSRRSRFQAGEAIRQRHGENPR
ncbi:MAG: roadblock/LC7 domain-containing protein [Acidobacteriota bacterium]